MTEKTPGVTWQAGTVSHGARRKLLGHKGGTVWLTGLPGSGKTTIAIALEERLIQRRVLAYRLDGDNLRHGLCGDLGFSEADRDENVRRAGEAAKLFADAGLVVLASFISPYAAGREKVAKAHADAHIPFIDVFVDCPVDVAEQRDPKGLYAKARAGKVKGFTGIDAPYEAPEKASIHLKTVELTVEEEVEILCGALEAAGIIPA
jgi:adenylylsulfate kinase